MKKLLIFLLISLSDICRGVITPIHNPVLTGSIVSNNAVSSIAALRAAPLTPGIAFGYEIAVGGYRTNGDGGGGTFFYDPSSVLSDNGGTVITPASGPGAWLREFNGSIDAKWFGAYGTGLVDDSVAIMAAYAASGGGKTPIHLSHGAYLITTETLSLGGGSASTPLILWGDGQGTQIINNLPSSTATITMNNSAYVILRDMLITGNSSHKNDGVLITGGAGRIEVDNVVCQMAGKGFVVSAANTVIFRTCRSWPSGNSGALTVSQTVTASDISHGIYMTGSYANDISIYDFDNEPASTYSAGMCAIKCDATTADAIRIFGGTMEGSGSSVVGTGRYSISLTNVNFGWIACSYLENTDMLISACRYVTMMPVDMAGAPNTLSLTGNSAFNVFNSVYVGTISVASGCMYNTFDNCGVQTLSDSGTNTIVRTMGGAVTIPDYGNQKIVFSAYLSSGQTVGSSTTAVLLCNAETFDPFFKYSTSTGRFTPGVPGYYQLNTSVIWTAMTSGKQFNLSFYKNGGLLPGGRIYQQAGVTGSAAQTIPFIVQATSPSDYFEVRVFNGDTTSQVVVEGSFSGHSI